MKINEKLKQIRKGKCLSQTEVAEQLGVTRQLVSSWEINIIPPKGHMKKLASIWVLILSRKINIILIMNILMFNVF